MIVRLTAICGSLRKESYTRAALRVASKAATCEGAVVDFIDLRQLSFPPRNPDVHIYEDPSSYPDDVKRVRPTISKSNVFLIGTPEYHGGYSGVLKSFLDYFDVPDFQDKLVGLVAADGWHVFDQLRTVFRNLRAWVVPRQVAVDESNFANGVLIDPSVIERLNLLGQDLVRYGKLLALANNGNALVINGTKDSIDCKLGLYL